MCSAVTWLRHATTCAHTVRLLSAHFDFSAIVYRCPIAIYPPTALWLSHSKNCCFLEKIYFHLRFNIHLPNSIYIYRIQYTSTKFNIHHLYNLSFNRPPFFVKIHTNFHNTLRPRLIWYCIPLFADLLQNCPYSSTMSNAWQYCASGRMSASGQDSST